jgi:hypothetical protein
VRSLWLLPLVLALAVGAWISAMDTTGDPATTWLLCGATALAATAFFVLRWR